MTFQQLLQGAEVLSQSGNPAVAGVEYDSRRARPGIVFVAMKGETSDGNRFIDQAIAAGAVGIVTDSAAEAPRPAVAWAQVVNGRRALARLSANFYKRPAERIANTGITGTNGKSTTAFLIESILQAAGRKTALVGTIEYHVAGKILPAPHTTPEALELNRLLSEGLGLGVTEAVMEVSSHALEQQRVFGIPFDVAVFIVNIKNGGARRVGPATFEKHLFGAEVIFHRAVVVEMVASEIREYSHIKRNSKNALLLQRMR